MFGCLLVHIRLHMNVYSSPSLHNEYLWYDKLWGAFSASSYLVLISFQSCPHHGLDVCWCFSHLVSFTHCLQIYNDNKHSKHSRQIFYENMALPCSKSGTICRVHRLWRKENALVGSSDLFSISRPLLKNLEWSEMGSQLQNRLNIAEQKNNLILRESFHWDLFIEVLLLSESNVSLNSSFYLRQDLIWNPCNSFLWCFILAPYLQFHKSAILKNMWKQTQFLGNMYWRQRCLPQRAGSRVFQDELCPWLWPGRTRGPLRWMLHLL